MRVMCIKDFTKEINNAHPVPPIKFGEVYNIIDESEYKGDKFVALQEFGWDHRFKKSYFAPVSEIDEKEMVREYNVVTNL